MDGVPESLSEQVISNITSRLSQIDTLRLPGLLLRGEQPASIDTRSKYLHNLLTHDPGVFLERHAELLQDDEITAFHAIRDSSYEIDFYLKLLEDTPKTANNSSNGNSRRSVVPSLNSTSKNRRLAQMEQLDRTGYFSEDAMRRREPYLHQLYIGQYAIDRSSDMPGAERSPGDVIISPRTGDGGHVGRHAIEGLSSTSSNPGKAAQIRTEHPGSGIAQNIPSSALASSIMDRQDELELLLQREAERVVYAMQEEESESDSEDEKGEGPERGKGMREESIPGGEWPLPDVITNEQR